MKRHDITGQKFGKLTAIKISGRTKSGNSIWLCHCECGGVSNSNISHLRNGHTKSCGCINENMYKTHGMHKSSEYKTYAAMKDRCDNPNNTQYKDYGGRGITYCERWNDFASFFEDMGVRPENMTLDRIDNDGDYSPENCKWSSRKDQQNNRRNNVVLEYKGEMLTMKQAAVKYGIHQGTLRSRLKNGWPVDAAIETKPSKYSKGLNYYRKLGME